jgi:hemoglobin
MRPAAVAAPAASRRSTGLPSRHLRESGEEEETMTSPTTETNATATEATLYQRLGGYDALCAATDDLLARLQADPQLGGYWKGASFDNRRRARQLIVDYLVEASGGPAFYTGRDMKTAHAGMGISQGDWEVFIGHTRAMLAAFGVGEREQGEVLGFLDTLKGDVVEA